MPSYMVPLGRILTQLWACRIIYSVTDPIHARPTFWTAVPLDDTKPIDFDVYRITHTVLVITRIPTVKLKIPGKSRIQKFCYIQVIVFDHSYLPVAAVGT